MTDATVRAYAQPTGGSVLLVIYVGDKRRGAITVCSKVDDGFDYDLIERKADALDFVQQLRDAAIEAKKGG